MRTVAAVLALSLLVVPSLARAVEYEVQIDVDTEDDLYELLSSEQISEDTFNALIDLMRRGVDLNEADAEEMYALPGLTLKDVQAIVTYRKAAGKITDAQALVEAGVLTDEKVRRIAPFLLQRPSGGSPFAASGRIRARTIWTSEDSRFPASSLEGRLLTLRNLTVGLHLVLTRDDLANVVFDRTRQALTADGPATRLKLAKVYADWKTPSYELLAGNFRAGFGQRLIFDNTPLYTPNGVYPDEVLFRSSDLVRECSESAGELAASPCGAQASTYVTPDFAPKASLFGFAAAARQIDFEGGWLQVVGFVSREVHDIYQYEIYDAGHCSDPNLDKDPRCQAPLVFHTRDDILAPTSRFSFQTLPDMWAEPLGGGNASVFFGRRAHVGVTGYYAKPEWLVTGMDLSFQEWSRFPYGGGYGAVGGDAAYGFDNLDFGLELGKSFDGTPSGGGFGIVSRSTMTWPKNELELVLRYYDSGFANPYSGAIAEPDEVDGQRARDEVGGRLRFAGRVSRHIDVHALADFWVQPSANIPKIRVEARADYLFAQGISVGLYGRWQDKDLGAGGDGQCYETTFDTTENGEPVPCKGQKFDVGLVARFEPVRKLFIDAQYQHRLLDDPRYPDKYRQDVSAWLILNWWPMEELRFYARAHYLNEDISDNTYLEQSLWSFVEATYRTKGDFLVRLRYDNRYFLDDRSSTLSRVPNPEHWLRVELESKF